MYGLVSDRGNLGGVPEAFDRHRVLFARVANIDILKWIKNFMRKYEK